MAHNEALHVDPVEELPSAMALGDGFLIVSIYGCQPCELMEDTLAIVSRQLGYRPPVNVKVAGQSRKGSDCYGRPLRFFPTCLLFKNGSEAFRIEGAPIGTAQDRERYVMRKVGGLPRSSASI